jgi:hypothetical protein
MTDIVLRILGTGSRNLTDRALVRRALIEVLSTEGTGGDLPDVDEVLIVHGAQGYVDERTGETKGADLLIDQEAKALGMRTKPMPAKWRDPCRSECNHGPRKLNRSGQDYCQLAGFYRNQDMVDLRAYDLCIAFPLGRSVGTRDCIRRAAAAGIEVVLYEVVPMTAIDVTRKVTR